MNDKKSQTQGYFDAIRDAATGDKGRVDTFKCAFCLAQSSDPYYCFDKPFCDHEHAMEWAQERIKELEESLRQADEFIESIGWDVDFEAFKAQGEQD